MGREVKRVSLGFEWPINKVWEGFLNPNYEKSVECSECGGSGYSTAAKLLQAAWYGNVPFKPEDRGSVPFTTAHPAIRALAERNVANCPSWMGNGVDAVEKEAKRLAAHFNGSWGHHLNAYDVAALLKANRLYDLTHTWTKGVGWRKKTPEVIPTPEEVNAWSLSGMGHDSINCSVVVAAECERLGVSDTCEQCGGEGCIWDSKEDRATYEEWEPSEPPAGEGWQIWETVSEGSPISPVFATPEELAQHMAGTRWGADTGTSYEKWLAFIRGPGWAPTMVMDAFGVRTGVDACAPEKGG